MQPRASRMNAAQRKKAHQDKWMVENYADFGVTLTAETLELSPGTVRSRASRLGIRLPKEKIAAINLENKGKVVRKGLGIDPEQKPLLHKLCCRRW